MTDSSKISQGQQTTPPVAPQQKDQLAKSRIFLGIGTVVILCLFLLPRQDPLMIITAESRGLQYIVANVQNSHVLFRDPAAVITHIGAKKECETGLLEPMISSEVTYSIFDDFLLIEVAAKNAEASKDNIGARFRLAKSRGKTLEIKQGGSISYGPGTGCKSPDGFDPVRLPIWGSAVLGRTPLPSTMVGRTDPFSGLLISGQVSVFGQKLWGNGLYPAGEFELPAGSRLSSAATSDRAEVAPWWGFAAYVAPTADTALLTLSVSASTTTKKLNINRQAGPIAESIEASFFTRLSGEPQLANFAAVLASIFFLIQLIAALRDLWKK